MEQMCFVRYLFCDNSVLRSNCVVIRLIQLPLGSFINFGWTIQNIRVWTEACSKRRRIEIEINRTKPNEWRRKTTVNEIEMSWRLIEILGILIVSVSVARFLSWFVKFRILSMRLSWFTSSIITYYFGHMSKFIFHFGKITIRWKIANLFSVRNKRICMSNYISMEIIEFRNMWNLNAEQKWDFIYGNNPNFIIEKNLFLPLICRVSQNAVYTGEIWNVMFVCVFCLYVQHYYFNDLTAFSIATGRAEGEINHPRFNSGHFFKKENEIFFFLYRHLLHSRNLNHSDLGYFNGFITQQE